MQNISKTMKDSLVLSSEKVTIITASSFQFTIYKFKKEELQALKKNGKEFVQSYFSTDQEKMDFAADKYYNSILLAD